MKYNFIYQGVKKMKKIISAVALTLCIVLSCCFAVACSENNNSYNENKFAELERVIEDLKNQIGKLENENNSLKDELEEIKNSKDNVFWTEKQEYSQNETMTVYYGNSAVFKIKVSDNSPRATLNKDCVTGQLLLTSLLTDINGGSLIKTSYLEYGENIASNDAPDGGGNYICYKNVEKALGATYRCTLTDDVINAKEVKLVICVPGTPFPMAYFKISNIFVD